MEKSEPYGKNAMWFHVRCPVASPPAGGLQYYRGRTGVPPWEDWLIPVCFPSLPTGKWCLSVRKKTETRRGRTFSYTFPGSYKCRK